MVLMEIHTIFENRKNSILQILNCSEKSLALEKRKELEGAVNEIELFLKTLEYYSNGTSNSKKEAPLGNLMRSPEGDDKEGFFNRFGGFFKRR
jgi:hypothetical protein